MATTRREFFKKVGLVAGIAAVRLHSLRLDILPEHKREKDSFDTLEAGRRIMASFAVGVRGADRVMDNFGISAGRVRARIAELRETMDDLPPPGPFWPMEDDHD